MIDGTLETIRNAKLLAIVRADRQDWAQQVVDTLADAGVKAIEVSLTTPGAVEVIQSLASRPRRTYVVGAGTVLTSEQTSAVAAAGAQFIVTPGLSESIEAAASLGLPSLVGVLTPSEAIEAMRRGASMLKLFPADVGGPALLKALRAPLPSYEFVPVGGVSVAAVGDFLSAGAVALGVGSALTGSGHEPPDLGWVSAQAAAYQSAISAWVREPA